MTIIRKHTVNNIEIEIDSEKATIKYEDQEFIGQGYKIVHFCTWFETEMGSGSIVIKPIKYKELNGKIDKDSREQYPKLKTRLYGVDEFQFFSSLKNQNLELINIFKRAMMNNQMEALENLFGFKAVCFDPFNNFNYIIPIEASISVSGDTATINVITTGATTITDNDGDIVEETINCSFVYNLYDDSNNLLIGSQESNVFSGLMNGNYKIIVASTIDTGKRSFDVVINNE